MTAVVEALDLHRTYRTTTGAVRLANPYLFVTILLVPSVTQILFFAYLGRAAGVEDDSFYVVGNALVAAAVPVPLRHG